VMQELLYTLWDLGLQVGHSLRSLGDCVAMARTDFPSRTSMQEARLVTGDRAHLLPLGTYANIRIVSPRDFIHAVDTDAGPQERPPVRNTRWAIDQRCTSEGPS